MKLEINVTWPARELLSVEVNCNMKIRNSRRATPKNAPAMGEGASAIVIDDCFSQRNRVLDDDRYRIRCRDNDIDLWHPHSPPVPGAGSGPLAHCQPFSSFEQTLVVLMESPHRHEYLKNCIDLPIAPARGIAGCNIYYFLTEIIRSCPHLHRRLKGRDTRVILANPIQFQCSLVSVIKCDPYGDWKKIRDALWKELWHCQSIREEFKQRLECYRPNFIVNACTHSSHKKNCRCMSRGGSESDRDCRKRTVNEFLEDHFPHARIYQVAHPASGHWAGGTAGLRLSERSPRRDMMMRRCCFAIHSRALPVD